MNSTDRLNGNSSIHRFLAVTEAAAAAADWLSEWGGECVRSARATGHSRIYRCIVLLRTVRVFTVCVHSVYCIYGLSVLYRSFLYVAEWVLRENLDAVVIVVTFSSACLSRISSLFGKCCTFATLFFLRVKRFTCRFKPAYHPSSLLLPLSPPLLLLSSSSSSPVDETKYICVSSLWACATDEIVVPSSMQRNCTNEWITIVIIELSYIRYHCTVAAASASVSVIAV